MFVEALMAGVGITTLFSVLSLLLALGVYCCYLFIEKQKYVIAPLLAVLTIFITTVGIYFTVRLLERIAAS